MALSTITRVTWGQKGGYEQQQLDACCTVFKLKRAGRHGKGAGVKCWLRFVGGSRRSRSCQRGGSEGGALGVGA
jgi:hypothetical protein